VAVGEAAREAEAEAEVEGAMEEEDDDQWFEAILITE